MAFHEPFLNINNVMYKSIAYKILWFLRCLKKTWFDWH